MGSVFSLPCASIPCSDVVIFTTTAPVCVWKPIHLHVVLWSQSRYTPKEGLIWKTKKRRGKKNKRINIEG